MLIPWKHIQNMLTVDDTWLGCFRVWMKTEKKVKQILFKQRSLYKSSKWTFPRWKCVFEMARVTAEKMFKTSFFTNFFKSLMKFMDLISPEFLQYRLQRMNLWQMMLELPFAHCSGWKTSLISNPAIETPVRGQVSATTLPCTSTSHLFQLLY